MAVRESMRSGQGSVNRGEPRRSLEDRAAGMALTQVNSACRQGVGWIAVCQRETGCCDFPDWLMARCRRLPSQAMHGTAIELPMAL